MKGKINPAKARVTKKILSHPLLDTTNASCQEKNVISYKHAYSSTAASFLDKPTSIAAVAPQI